VGVVHVVNGAVVEARLRLVVDVFADGLCVEVSVAKAGMCEVDGVVGVGLCVVLNVVKAGFLYRTVRHAVGCRGGRPARNAQFTLSDARPCHRGLRCGDSSQRPGWDRL